MPSDSPRAKSTGSVPWPSSHEYFEAMQHPDPNLLDGELRGCRVLSNAWGPLRWTGGSADVFRLMSPNGAEWAVKCFTRAATGLQDRYRAISGHLEESPLPFMVHFQFLADGILIRGQKYPIVKMQWIEGQNLLQFIEASAHQPAVLDQLFALWIKLAHLLAEARIAHGDLQHENILLVPRGEHGGLQLRLVDYDGMYVPKLAGRSSGEAGMASFQHPQRRYRSSYGLEVDRFSHLAILTGIRAVRAGGRALWDRFSFDKGLLFQERDYLDPASSPLFQELLQSPDEAARTLAGRLVLACRRSMVDSPSLKTVLDETTARPLSTGEQMELRSFLERRLARAWKLPESTAAATASWTPRSPRGEPGSSVPSPSVEPLAADPPPVRLEAPAPSGSTSAAPALATRRRAAANPWRNALPWAMSAVLVIAAVAALGAALLREPYVEPFVASYEPPGSRVPIAPPPPAPALAFPLPGAAPMAIRPPERSVESGTPESGTPVSSSVPAVLDATTATAPPEDAPPRPEDEPPSPRTGLDVARLAKSDDRSLADSPFAGWPREIALPTADTSDWDSPFVLGSSPALNRRKLRVELLGGDVSSGRVGRFSVSELKTANADSTWLIHVDDAKSVRRIATIRIRDERLVFQWTVDIEEVRRLGVLRNCVLRLRQGGASHAMALRIPRAFPPVRVTLFKPSVSRASVPDLPDDEHVTIKTQLESARLFVPDATTRRSNQDARWQLFLSTYSVNLDDIEVELPVRIKLDLSLTKDVQVTASFQIRSPEKYDWEFFKMSTMKRMLDEDEVRRLRYNRELDESLRLAYREIDRMTNAKGELGILHLRGYYKADDVTVELFNTR